MTNPLVSVVIPAYNAEKTIKATIESVLNQNYTSIELIVIDDGSTDKTANMVWRMRSQCNQHRVKLHLIAQQNAGVSQARNRGVQEAQGEFIAFLDADDQWLDTKLSNHVEHLQQSPNVCLSYAKVNFLTTNGALRTSSKLLSRSLVPEDCLSDNPTVSPSNWVIKKSVFQQLNGFDETMTHAEDQEFLIRLMRETHLQINGIEQVLMNYATSQAGLSADIESMYVGWQSLMESMKGGDNVIRNYASHHMNYCMFLAKRTVHIAHHFSLGFKYFFKAMRADPVQMLFKPKQTISIFIGLIYGSSIAFLSASRGTVQHYLNKRMHKTPIKY